MNSPDLPDARMTAAWHGLELIRELIGADLLAGRRRGGDIDLDAMPEQIAACWHTEPDYARSLLPEEDSLKP